MDKPLPELIKATRTRLTAELTPEKIRDLRSRLDLTQEQFAEIIGCSKQTISFWEQGRRKPSGPALTAITYLVLMIGGL